MDKKTRQEILKAYQTSRNSIQDIARIYKVTVPEVLDLIGEGKSKSVTAIGDQIAPDEIGEGASFNSGKKFNIPYTTD